MKKTKDCIIDIQNPDGLELSNSKLKTWRHCQFCYYLKYIEKLKPIALKKSLTMGSWVHSCLEAKNRGQSMNEAFQNFKKENWDKLFIEEKNDLGDIPGDVRKMLVKYNESYNENDKIYTPVLIERDFMLELPNSPVILTGKIDRIVTDNKDRYWIWEYKTAKNIPENEIQQIIDPQTAIYQYVVNRFMKLGIIPVKQIAGVVYDYIRNKAPSAPFELKSGGLSVAKNKLGCDYKSYLNKIHELHLNEADYTEALSILKAKECEFLKRIAITKDNNSINRIMVDMVFTGNEIYRREHSDKPYYPRSINYTCTSNGGSKCDYSDACILDLQGHDYKDLIGTLYERRTKDESDEEDREKE